MTYADDPHLFRTAADLLAGPLRAGDTVVAVATPAHLFGLDAALSAAGLEFDTLRACGRWIELDASDLLAGLLVGDVLDPRPLIPIIAHYEAEVSKAGGRLHVFSEMAALLWERGLGVAALELEDAGNHLQGLFGFDLICGWPDDHTLSEDARSLIRPRHTQILGAADTADTAGDHKHDRPPLEAWPIPTGDLILHESSLGGRDVGQAVADAAVTVGSLVSADDRTGWLRRVTDLMGEGLCTLNAQGHIVYVNPCGQQLLDVPERRALGGSFVNRLLDPHASDTFLAFRDRLIGADFDGQVPGEPTEARLLRPDSSALPIEYVATALPPDPDGHPQGWVVVFRDISQRVAERQQLQDEVHHAQWMARIDDALAHDHFVLHAQPIVDLATGRTVQHELLIRLDDPDEGLVFPGAFLPTAEAYGLVPAIDRWVIVNAMQLAAAGHPVELNLSARSFTDPSLPYYIEQLLIASNVDPALLVFELTETALLDNDEAAGRFAARIRAMGCQLALDDFGTGYGAFTYLKNLPVDVLKIDLEFVRDATTNLASRHLIDAVVNLARSFGLTTVAEGVENQATLELLTQLGVDRAQGYHLGRPGPLDTTLLLDGQDDEVPIGGRTAVAVPVRSVGPPSAGRWSP